MPSLEITGKLGLGALTDFSSLTPFINENPSSYVVFSMRQDYDIPVETVFNYTLENHGTKIINLFRLIAVTQQYNLLMPEIPRGWNAVCVFKPISSPPFILDSLPTVDGWYENNEGIRLNYSTLVGDLGT